MPDKVTLNKEQLQKLVESGVEQGLSGDDIRAYVAEHVNVQPTFWENHPKIKQVAEGALGTLPFVGGLAGASIASVPGAVTGPGDLAFMATGAGLGTGAGRGARDLLAEGMGLEHTTTPTSKAARIGLDTAIGGLSAAAAPGIEAAIRHPLDTAADVLESIVRPKDTALDVAKLLRGGYAQAKPSMTRVNMPMPAEPAPPLPRAAVTGTGSQSAPMPDILASTQATPSNAMRIAAPPTPPPAPPSPLAPTGTGFRGGPVSEPMATAQTTPTSALRLPAPPPPPPPAPPPLSPFRPTGTGAQIPDLPPANMGPSQTLQMPPSPPPAPPTSTGTGFRVGPTVPEPMGTAQTTPTAVIRLPAPQPLAPAPPSPYKATGTGFSAPAPPPVVPPSGVLPQNLEAATPTSRDLLMDTMAKGVTPRPAQVGVEQIPPSLSKRTPRIPTPVTVAEKGLTTALTENDIRALVDAGLPPELAKMPITKLPPEAVDIIKKARAVRAGSYKMQAELDAIAKRQGGE